MYLHLGSDTVVKSQDVIGVFQLEKTSLSKFTKEFLHKASTNSQVINVTYEMPKSFIVCKTNQKKANQLVYIAQVSSETIYQRATKYPIFT